MGAAGESPTPAGGGALAVVTGSAEAGCAWHPSRLPAEERSVFGASDAGVPAPPRQSPLLRGVGAPSHGVPKSLPP